MLPIEFTTPRIDEQGRRYVIHEPSGVKYFLRDEKPKGNAPAVTVYSRNAEGGRNYSKPKAKPARRAVQQTEGDGFARATFIEGSAP